MTASVAARRAARPRGSRPTPSPSTMPPTISGRSIPPNSAPTKCVRQRPQPSFAPPTPNARPISPTQIRKLESPANSGVQPASMREPAKTRVISAAANRESQPSAGWKRIRRSPSAGGRPAVAVPALTMGSTWRSRYEYLGERRRRPDAVHGDVELGEGVSQRPPLLGGGGCLGERHLGGQRAALARRLLLLTALECGDVERDDHAGDAARAERGKGLHPVPVQRRRDDHRGHASPDALHARDQRLRNGRRSVAIDRGEQLHDLEVLAP